MKKILSIEARKIANYSRYHNGSTRVHPDKLTQGREKETTSISNAWIVLPTACFWRCAVSLVRKGSWS